MSDARLRSTGLSFVLLAAVAACPYALEAQVVWDVVNRESLLRVLPADTLYSEPRELVGTVTGVMSTVRPRFEAGVLVGGVPEDREVLLVLHARAGSGPDLYDRGVAALTVDTLFRVALVAEIEPGLGYVERFETLAPPGDGPPVHLLHVRYAQTGSGGVTEDLLFGLDSSNRLVEVPISPRPTSPPLQAGESLCCGSFTSFDESLIELTVFVTRGGRPGITDRVRTPFGLEGRYRYESDTRRYVPDFRLVPLETGGREPTRQQP